MDKDLRDAVLAAFDDEPDDGEPENEAGEEDGGPTEEEAAGKGGDTPGASGKTAKADAGKKARLAKAAMASRMRGKPGGLRRPAKASVSADVEGGVTEASTQAPAAPVRGSRPASEAAAPGKPHGGKLLAFSLALNVVTILLLVLVLIHVSNQFDELRGYLEQRLDGVQEGVLDARELAKFSRIKLGVYQEPNKRPQAAIVVVEEKDGHLRIGKTVVRPLEEDPKE